MRTIADEMPTRFHLANADVVEILRNLCSSGDCYAVFRFKVDC